MWLSLLVPLCLFTPGRLAADDAAAQDAAAQAAAMNRAHPVVVLHDQPYKCLEGPRVGGHELAFPERPHCAYALDQILKADKADAPMLIGRTSGFIVPHNWSAGTCGIYINTADGTPSKPVTLSLSTVVRIVLLMMERCIDQGPGYGGAAALGSWDDSGGLLDVVVLGRHMLPGEVPPGSRVVIG